MPKRFYVTTPIYYVNDVPHLGHAYTTIAADALRRYHLLRGDETRMLTGTDEHGLKIERAAAEAGQSPRAFVDEMSARFRRTWPELGVRARRLHPHDRSRATRRWCRSSGRRSKPAGDLYLGTYEDWYCVGCESFKTEKELLAGQRLPAPPEAGREGEGGDLLLPPLEVPGAAARTSTRAPRLRRAGEPPQRGA